MSKNYPEITNVTEIDSRGIMNEIITGDFGNFCFEAIMKPVDIEKVDFLVNCCRLRYSEINGVDCTDPTAPGLDKCSDPVTAAMTGKQFSTMVELEELDFIELRFKTHPEIFNIPGFRKIFDVLKNAIQFFHASNGENKEEVSKTLLEAINTGNEYLRKSGVTINQQIGYDYIIKQPVL